MQTRYTSRGLRSVRPQSCTSQDPPAHALSYRHSPIHCAVAAAWLMVSLQSSAQPTQQQGSQGPSDAPLIERREAANPPAALEPSPASVQDSGPPRVGLRPSEGGEGLKAGGFKWFPSVTVTQAYDDNIFATRTNQVHDWITTVTPAIRGESDWTRHRLIFDAGIAADRYWDNSNENVIEYWIGASGRFDLATNTRLLGGLRYEKEYEDRASPELQVGNPREPVPFTTASGHLGVEQQFGAYLARLVGVAEKIDFDTVPGIVGTNDDRDRDQRSIGLRVSRRVSPVASLFVQGVTDKREYDRFFDDNGFHRDSDGYRLVIGSTFALRDTLSGEAFAGLLKQDYDDVRLPDVSKPYFGARVRWRPVSPMLVTAFLDRSVNETVIAGASSFLETTLGARVERYMSPQWLFSGSVAYTNSDYQGADLTNDLYSASFGVRRYFRDDWFLGLTYRFLHRNSNDPQFEYFKNQIFASIGYAPGGRPRFGATGLQPGALWEPVGDPYSGFYLGGYLADLGVGIHTTGPRGGGGTDLDEFAGWDQGFGFFGGYGRTFGRWYLGAEADWNDIGASWHHGRSPGGRTFSVAQEDTWGLAARVGYLVPGGLVYGHVGGVRSTFDSQYINGSLVPAVISSQQNRETGLRVGVGADVPLARGAFVRTDYSHTNYADFDYFDGAQFQRYAPSTSLFKVGLGWRFGGKETGAAVQIDPRELRGLYGGATLTHGVWQSFMDAVHGDDGSVLKADFGWHGLGGGAFAGYGHTWGRVYVSGEVDGNANGADWRHERTTPGAGGRDFSVHKSGSLGASVRAGYVTAGGSLLYVRYGASYGKFNTIYRRGPTFPIDRDDEKWGNRWGLGSEVKLSDRTFMRMEYSRIDYGTYSFATAHGSPDFVSITNKESIFGLSVGGRF